MLSGVLSQANYKASGQNQITEWRQWPSCNCLTNCSAVCLVFKSVVAKTAKETFARHQSWTQASIEQVACATWHTGAMYGTDGKICGEICTLNTTRWEIGDFFSLHELLARNKTKVFLICAFHTLLFCLVYMWCLTVLTTWLCVIRVWRPSSVHLVVSRFIWMHLQPGTLQPSWFVITGRTDLNQSTGKWNKETHYLVQRSNLQIPVRNTQSRIVTEDLKQTCTSASLRNWLPVRDVFRWFEMGCTIWAKSVRAKSKHL